LLTGILHIIRIVDDHHGGALEPATSYPGIPAALAVDSSINASAMS
jgi:hypothetical protein